MDALPQAPSGMVWLLQKVIFTGKLMVPQAKEATDTQPL